MADSPRTGRTTGPPPAWPPAPPPLPAGAAAAPARPPGRRRERREAAEDRQVSGRTFPCTACGADLRYSPGDAALTCGHCGSVTPVAALDGAAARQEHCLDTHLADGSSRLAREEALALSCRGCGASVSLDPGHHARLCPFCDQALVGDPARQRRIVPQGVLPFALTREGARGAMRDWLTRRWFAPNDIAREAEIDHFHGVYVPFWTFDAATETDYVGQRGTRVGSGKSRRTVWRTVRGTVSGPFDDVVVSGSHSVSRVFKDALAPWPLAALETYQPAYLAGFSAENHTVDLAEGFLRAEVFMKAVIADWIRKDIGGQRQRITSSQTRYSARTFRHILAPVWITHYRLDGRTYRLSVNGHTGKVYGDRPFSLVKLLAATVALILGLGGAGFLISSVPWAA